MTPRIYVACLAAYNNGKLHGTWINANQDPEDLQADIAKVLASSPELGAEEWAIHDSEDLGDISEHESLEDISERAALVIEHGSLGLAVLKYHSNLNQAKEALEENYQGTFWCLEDWAESYLEDTGTLREIPESLRYYFDFEKWARDAEMSGDIYTIDVPEGVAVFHS